MRVARTTVDIDPDALAAAREVLGSGSLSATVNAALRDVARRSVLTDFDVRRDIDGSPAEVEAGRQDREPARTE